MKKKLIILVFLLLAASGGFYLYSQQKNAQNGPTLTVYGNVDIRDVALSFRVSGRIEQVLFEEGDQVHKGDVVAVLDKGPFEDELALRQAELTQAMATLKNAESIYARRADLVKTGAVSQTAYDEALAARDEARARVETATARVDLAQTRLEDTKVHAPNDGVILTRVREEGSIVAEGAPVYTLALNNPVWVRTYVDEPNLGHVFPGQKATVKTDTSDTYLGQIGFISPQAEFTPKNVETTQLRTDLVYRLRVIVENPDKGLRQGMPVTVSINKRKAGE